MIEHAPLYLQLAAAYVRGALPDAPARASDDELVQLGKTAGLKMHRFKRTMELPRVRAVLGVLQGLQPENLLDVGTGRGVFLWPLMDAFPALPITAVEPLPERRRYLDAVVRGGMDQLTVLEGQAEALPFPDQAFDVVTVLEVLEHQDDPSVLARAAVRLARRSVIVSVPSQPDENPEHVQLFNRETLAALLTNAGASNVRIDYVLNHIIAVARVG
jgi:ubiquinone/menaquinone biosynthesis C-methylase UbiE